MTASATLPMAAMPFPRCPVDPGTAACPECGRPAEVVNRFMLASTDGPVEHLRLRCDAGRHHLTLIVERNQP